MATERIPDRVLLAFGALLVVLSLVAIPFGGNDTSGSQTAAGGSAISGAVVIKDFKYAPENTTVKAGTKITWTNGDSAKHTSTSTEEGLFTTDTLDKGQSKSVTLDKPGTYEYFCQFHEFMTATITVE